jgi:hypothetical protein
VQAAAILGVHRNTLAKWIDQGCPVQRRADRARGLEWEIIVADVVDWRIRRAVDEATAVYKNDGGTITLELAERRRAIANAITAEIEADEAPGNVVSRRDALDDMVSFCQVLKTGNSNAASRIASRAAGMSSAPEIEALVREELNRSYRAAQSELTERWAGERVPDDSGGGEDQPPQAR